MRTVLDLASMAVRWVDRLCVVARTSLRQASDEPAACFLLLHSVGGLPEAPYLVRSGLASISPEQLRALCRFFKKRGFSSLTVGEFLACRQGGRIPPRTVVMTFDDGFRDNHTYAVEILQEQGMKATFYVTAGWVGREQPVWLHRAAYYADRYPDAVATAVRAIDPERWRQFFGLFKSTLSPVRDALLVFRQGLSPSQQREVLGGLVCRCGSSPAGRLYMSWKELDEVRRAGMEIGAHSVTHRSLWTLGGAEARKEIAHSKEILERRLGTAVTSFSYPFGHFLPGHRQMVASAGYLGAVSGRGSHNHAAAEPFELGRYGMNRGTLGCYTLGSICLNRADDPVGRLNRRLGRHLGRSQADPDLGIVTHTRSGLEYNTVDAAAATWGGIALPSGQ